ncbi:MAG: nitrilase-related carbon-nitrogen hydrolase [Gammaproteobacteria bacterium]|nr:nitrilase-related carbon-nitrogen hydrolase [Gammaproteobacteria bacterium]
MNNKIDKRALIKGAAAFVGGSAWLGGAAMAQSAGGSVSVPANGRSYERVDLQQDVVTVSAVQSRVRAVDGKNPRKGIRANLDHMLELIDKTQFYGGKKDLLCFHEFPLQGWNPWDRKELERLSIEVPGPETEELSAKAREHGCYIKFGAYVVDRDWPGHILSVTSIIGPDGELIARDWKARNIKGVFTGFELLTTTVYNVMDQYIEMYGADAVIPVHRTPIGNLATSSTQLEPELFRAMAMKGAEIILRTATGGFTKEDMQMCARYNQVYTLIVNNAVSPENPGFMDDATGGSGGSAIYGPRGEELAVAASKFEQQVVARIPIAAYRARHRIPDVHWALYEPVFSAYRPRYQPDLFADYLPTSLQDAKRYLDELDGWQ